jgi:hypothetical protein
LADPVKTVKKELCRMDNSNLMLNFPRWDFNSLNKENEMLYYANMAIDAIQSGKTTWLQTFIKEDQVRQPLQQFVDAQTAFTKQITKTWYEVTGAASKSMVDKVFSKEVK